MSRRLRPLIPKPRNARQRKEQRLRLAACEAHLQEVQRLGMSIETLDRVAAGEAYHAPPIVRADLESLRIYLIAMQNELARDLVAAGYPMEGTVKARCSVPAPLTEDEKFFAGEQWEPEEVERMKRIRDARLR